MTESIVGKMVRSKAGHDKDTVYFVMKCDDRYAYLSDGKLKTIDKLKKKSIKHLQIINAETEVGKKIASKEICSDEEIKRTIKLFIKES